ncbi:hypothetical protein [Mesorhizobium sp.]|uniref:hypothetical protein n=1 Tax=Mesorhizobium sp. TaxID=1871066 RepID=UPI0011F44B21|nr:hypothetical protein [Mesorhizobium sp.]TIO08594.1 MAG: hypothetical protein E5X88_13380 [Mesorhizobium sp.]TIO33760.1 MAG: hypothetical protein E5X89_13710 [Mesorhizobium sp.]TIP09134.1 MAG: hypothetical protein E5X73_28980 [Mesorhizobium sp.]
MISAVSTTMTAATIGMAAMPVIAAAAAILSAGEEVIARTVSWSGETLRAKEKDDSADERQQQNSDVHPSGWGHLGLALFPRVGSQSGSTKRKRSP